MIATGLDLETTGLDPFAKDPHRITEICMMPYDLGTRRHKATLNQRVFSGRKIDAKASKVTGIVAADLVGCPPFAKIAPKVRTILSITDVLVIHNAEFDLPFLAAEMERAGVEMRRDVEVFCTMRGGMWASYDSKPPSLEELCWACGVSYEREKAHAAWYDVDRMMQCYFRALDVGLAELPKPGGDERAAA